MKGLPPDSWVEVSMHQKGRATGQVDQDISGFPLCFIANAKFPTNSAKTHVPLHATHTAFPTLATIFQLKNSLPKAIRSSSCSPTNIKFGTGAQILSSE
jgi:hypothetical protein